MIRSFADKETEKIFGREFSKKLPSDIQRIARRQIGNVRCGERINDLRVPPSNRLEKLKGERADQHSVRVNDQWRICFVWRETDVFDVEIVDYH